jgi:putative DNA primase/helicase
VTEPGEDELDELAEFGPEDIDAMFIDTAAPDDDPVSNVALFNFKCTDLGNAERMVTRFRGEIRYCSPRHLWFAWDSRRWQLDETGEINRKAKATVRAIYKEAAACSDENIRKAIAKHAYDSESGGRVAAMISFARSETGIPVMPAELDADPWLFNVLNGTIDLRTGKLGPHRREDLITCLSHVAYDPTARSELWERYLSDVTNGDAELAAYLQRAVGYALCGEASERAFFFLYGPGGTAKSTFIDVIAAAFGEYHSATSSDTWLVQTHTGGNRGDLVRLAGKRLVTSTEFKKNVRFDEKIMKSATGGDLIVASAKYEGVIEFKPSFTLWFAANDAPNIRDDDEAAWERVRRIPFDYRIPPEKKDRTLKRRLCETDVLAAVIAWAVQGCLDWQRDGLGTAAAISRSNADYRKDMDPVVGFFEDHCVFEAGATVDASALRRAYEDWCKEQGIRFTLSGKDFAQRLQAKPRNCTDGKSNGRRLWKGIRLLERWEDPRTPGTPGTPGHDFSQTPHVEIHREKFGKNGALPSLPTLLDEDIEREALRDA